MSALEWMVLFGGVAAIVWVNWYFFLAGRGSGAIAVVDAGTGSSEVVIEVQGGYQPATVRLRKDVPVRLVFDRKETSGCSEEVVIPDFRVRRFLPAHERTTVEITPDRAGTYDFTCGMGMLRGRLIVEE